MAGGAKPRHWVAASQLEMNEYASTPHLHRLNHRGLGRDGDHRPARRLAQIRHVGHLDELAAPDPGVHEAQIRARRVVRPVVGGLHLQRRGRSVSAHVGRRRAAGLGFRTYDVHQGAQLPGNVVASAARAAAAAKPRRRGWAKVAEQTAAAAVRIQIRVVCPIAGLQKVLHNCGACVGVRQMWLPGRSTSMDVPPSPCIC